MIRRADGFVMQEVQGLWSAGMLAWRMMGKRADVPGERLGTFAMRLPPLPDVTKFRAPAPSPKKP